MADHRYLIALGSNMRHHRLGGPKHVLRAAIEEMAALGLVVERVSPICTSAPLGPSRRRFANAAVLVSSALQPTELLALLQRIERDFGRRRGGQRWRARVLDLDIVLWDGGRHVEKELVVPHHRFRQRAFMLHPALAVAPDWRDPVTGLTLRQLHARLTRPRPASR